jgi:hypothetical protein
MLTEVIQDPGQDAKSLRRPGLQSLQYKGGPTLSAKGRWRKSTTGNMLAYTQDQ